MTTEHASNTEPIVAGVVTALVGFTSSFVVVVSGLRAVGATSTQAASGLLALTVTFGLGIIVLCVRYRMPITLAWSTPGAALLAAMGAGYHAGWPAAVGAFLVVGVLILATGLIPALGDLIARIPTPIAQAMLAGVLLTLCLAPIKSLAVQPLLTIPILVVWVVATRWLSRWALPLALVAALVVIGIYLAVHGVDSAAHTEWWPQIAWTTPHFDASAVVGIAIPLYVVTMASQNVPGVAVLSSFGYHTPWGGRRCSSQEQGQPWVRLSADTQSISPRCRRRWQRATRQVPTVRGGGSPVYPRVSPTWCWRRCRECW